MAQRFTGLCKPWGEWRYASADLLAAYFWAVVHDRPTRWAADKRQRENHGASFDSYLHNPVNRWVSGCSAPLPSRRDG